MRRSLYRLAAILGDLNALARGRIVERLARKWLYRVFSGLVRRVIR